jgi:hypothetical protein
VCRGVCRRLSVQQALAEEVFGLPAKQLTEESPERKDWGAHDQPAHEGALEERPQASAAEAGGDTGSSANEQAGGDTGSRLGGTAGAPHRDGREAAGCPPLRHLERRHVEGVAALHEACCLVPAQACSRRQTRACMRLATL